MKRFRFEALIFTVEFVYMVLELVASRVLSPYFGNSNLVWTVVIGIILLSGSIGNFVGGKIADKDNKEYHLKLVLLAISISVLITAMIHNPLATLVAMLIQSTSIGSIVTTVVLFFIPALFMGFISPIVLKLKLENIEVAGRTAGRLNAIATIGGITGTFVGGFLLIPNIVSSYILYMLVMILVCLVPLVDLKLKSWTNICVVTLMVASTVLLSINVYTNQQNAERILNGEVGYVYTYDTEYGHVKIYNQNEGIDKIRVLQVGQGCESATYTEYSRRYELVYSYLKHYNLMFDAGIDIDSILMIGGGGYSYPKYFLSTHLDKAMDVVEIDGQVTQIAKKYFYLDTLIDEYDLDKTGRLRLITDDGRVYLNKNQKEYDVILNDAFSGVEPVATLTTIEAIKHIKRSLATGGLYMSNVIAYMDGTRSPFLRAEVNTLSKVFKNVHVIPCIDLEDTKTIQNFMVIATDSAVSYDNTIDIHISAEDIVLTDAFCPVDQLCYY